MCPLLAHQKPGRALVVFVVPDREEGRGCRGERWSSRAHAAVPGSSVPSGQSQELSLTLEAGMVMEGWPIHVKVSLIS